jgi:hypothetical protein
MAIPSKNIRAERITGSFDASGINISGSLDITGSLFGTASFAVSASYAPVPVYIKRSDVSGSFAYCGVALTGSLETDSTWDITRITITEEGTASSQYATSVAWIDRETTIYT